MELAISLSAIVINKPKTTQRKRVPTHNLIITQLVSASNHTCYPTNKMSPHNQKDTRRSQATKSTRNPTKIRVSRITKTISITMLPRTSHKIELCCQELVEPTLENPAKIRATSIIKVISITMPNLGNNSNVLP